MRVTSHGQITASQTHRDPSPPRTTYCERTAPGGSNPNQHQGMDTSYLIRLLPSYSTRYFSYNHIQCWCGAWSTWQQGYPLYLYLPWMHISLVKENAVQQVLRGKVDQVWSVHTCHDASNAAADTIKLPSRIGFSSLVP